MKRLRKISMRSDTGDETDYSWNRASASLGGHCGRHSPPPLSFVLQLRPAMRITRLYYADQSVSASGDGFCRRRNCFHIGFRQMLPSPKYKTNGHSTGCSTRQLAKSLIAPMDLTWQVSACGSTLSGGDCVTLPGVASIMKNSLARFFYIKD